MAVGSGSAPTSVPRVAIPERYKLPVGLSLSTEIGYQRPNFSPDTWTIELRPIVDKKIGKFYMALQPDARDVAPRPGQVGEPQLLAQREGLLRHRQKQVAFGLEYYGAYGRLTSFDAARDTEQMFIPAVDIDFGPNWEFNFGVGVGVTQATDHLLVKAILGYRFNNKKN